MLSVVATGAIDWSSSSRHSDVFSGFAPMTLLFANKGARSAFSTRMEDREFKSSLKGIAFLSYSGCSVGFRRFS